MNNSNLILVDSNDNQVGELGKLESHIDDAHRHRAFTAFIKNPQGQLLMCRRSLKKPLWPTYWDASFSSHPWIGETVENASTRRLKEELGFSINVPFTDQFSYEYHVSWSEIFSEWEINHITLVEIDSNLDLTKINPEEVSEYRWMNWEEVIQFVNKDDMISPWLTIAVEKIKKDIKLVSIFK